jgi:Heavy metal binding domain
MKNSIFFIAFILFAIACNEPAKQNQSSETTVTAPETKAEVKADTTSLPTYVCPMDADITSHKADDKCSKCGMALVLKK